MATVINTFSDLIQAIQANPSGSYVLGANLDASGYSFASIPDFTGTLDGQGHSISNLQTTLFSKIDSQGLVENLNLANVNVTNAALASENDGTISNSSVTGTVVGGFGSYCGALVANNVGSISGSSSQATVRGAAGGMAGGLVGFNDTTGVISNSYSTGSVTGNNTPNEETPFCGGLVAENVGLITGCYATGPVINFGIGAGGLVGVNGTPGTISNSYAMGPVTASEVGGLVAVNAATILDSYATGFITETNNNNLPGGLVGLSFQGNTTTNSYWDLQTTGTTYSAGGTGLTTAQLESGTLPTGFVSTIWVDNAGQYPELRWQIPVNTLFTAGAEAVDFNNLTAAQAGEVAAGADIYHGLGGNDAVNLPNESNYNESVGNNATLGWSDAPASTFYTGSKLGDTYTVNGGDGSYYISEGAGTEFITINGNGNNTIAAGSGFDAVAITGNGNNAIHAGTGTISVTIAGGGALDLTGAVNIAALGAATIGNGSTLELGGSCTGGPICFAAGGTKETLQIDGTTMPSNTITGIALNDTIYLKNVSYDPTGCAILQSFGGGAQANVLTITENGACYNLQLDPSQSFAQEQFSLSSDPHGGTDITVQPGFELYPEFDLYPAGWFDQSQGGLPPAFIQGVDAAAHIIETTFTDLITVNVRVGYGTFQGAPFPSFYDQTGALGNPSIVPESYSRLRTSLISKGVPAAALPDKASLNGFSNFYISSAEYKALGLPIPPGGLPAQDGAIGIGTLIPDQNIVGVALHEFTHAMGRVAGGSAAPTSLDMFRYNGVGSLQFNIGNVPSTPAPRSYFSLDGGKTGLADFGQTSDPGDFLLRLTIGSTNIGMAAASAVPFTIVGLSNATDPFNEFYPGTLNSLTPLDILVMNALGFSSIQPGVGATTVVGTVKFTDSKGTTIQVPVNSGQTSYSANLSSLADGPITSSLVVGSSATVSGNTVTLDRDKTAEAPTLTVSSSLSVHPGMPIQMGITATPVDSDDTVSITIKGVPSYETITAGPGEIVTHKGSIYTVTSTTPGASITDLTLTSSFKGKGSVVNPFTVTASNTTGGETATSLSRTVTVTDPPILATNQTNGAPPSSPPTVDHVVALFNQFIAAGFPEQHGGQITTNALSQIMTNEQHFLAQPHPG